MRRGRWDGQGSWANPGQEYRHIGMSLQHPYHDFHPTTPPHMLGTQQETHKMHCSCISTSHELLRLLFHLCSLALTSCPQLQCELMF